MIIVSILQVCLDTRERERVRGGATTRTSQSNLGPAVPAGPQSAKNAGISGS